MRSVKVLIKDNNEKRELLSEENLAFYEEFLFYIRTDLRVDEQSGEEVLMDLLDHLLESQDEGKTGKDLFGDRPQAYADELIDALPKEKKRNVAVFVLSQMLGIAGFFSITLGIIYIALSFFLEVDTTLSLGNILTILVTVAILSLIAVSFIFKLIRSSLFRPKRSRIIEYLKAGLFGATLFAVILLLVWLVPEFGPEISLQWWMYVLFGFVLLAGDKVMDRLK
ncbi:hypothetical protein AUO94_00835 [Planococcus kocurii]|uniref:DUF1129 domain-containing protein n=1 Tax=Planococcus kocurii TaxID=1374 RepID=A0ABN4JV40_9BACL|nr:DUF1129 family protein [Planococcus kocurii]ALS77275.1 hypothetical protein AUO94_00835 [Planococcus kocurii]